MNIKKYLAFVSIILALVVIFVLSKQSKQTTQEITSTESAQETNEINNLVKQEQSLHPMSIESLRSRTYEGGQFKIEKELAQGTNYRQYIASYSSEGLKINGLLTVPTAPKPEKGFPAIIFMHGYIPPKQYSTTGNYSTYQPMLARAGFVTFKPDLRGHAQSEGEPVTAHFSEKYVVDNLYAIEFLKQHPDVDPSRIGYWGHSNGGEIGLRTMVVSKDIKAASLWAGVVGSFPDMLETYNSKIPFLKDSDDQLIKDNGLPSTNSEFWNKIDPYTYLQDISGPVQLQHGTADSSVPVELSIRLKEELEKLGESVEYYEYQGDDHNIAKNYSKAWQRTIEFFKKNL
jgi:uncharacterized protein